MSKTSASDTSKPKKERKMSNMGFLKKSHASVGKLSAAAFIEAHRKFLQSGELKKLSDPILASLDSKKLKGDIALSQLQEIVFNHELTVTKEVAEKISKGPSSPPKAHTAIILDSKGNIPVVKNAAGKEVKLQQDFDLPQEAERWINRRLVEGAVDWNGVIKHNKLDTKTPVLRSDAFASIYKPTKNPVMAKRPQTTAKLAFGGKAKQDHCHFSRG